MSKETTRREVLKGGIALAGIGALGGTNFGLPALAQGERLMRFTDWPEEGVNLAPTPDRRRVDITKIDGPITPADEWFTTQHYGHPEVDRSTYRLRVSGLVNSALELSLGDLRAMPSRDLVFGFECSGNGHPQNSLSSNGRWTGVPLRAVLERAGVQERAREFVFLGADHGEEEVVFRTQTFTVDQQYGRSLQRDIALSDEPLLAYDLNGDPLSVHQGRPLRLLVPGWYGAPNVKFLSEIHVQEDQYLGKYQARWYRTLKAEVVNGEKKWKETAITKMRLKSFIARVTEMGGQHKVFGVVMHDGTPLRSVEVKIDDGPWQSATLDPATREKYSWKFFSYDWSGASAGEHTIVSRVTDQDGNVQPTAGELEDKLSFLERNSQHPRTVVIA